VADPHCRRYWNTADGAAYRRQQDRAG